MTRILAHIHTMNDENVVGMSVAAVLAQTHPIEHILIVDNGSVDGTLDQEFPDNATVIAHGCNLGTSGSVRTGLEFALEHNYDWIWVFDADAAAHPDALEKLLEYYDSLPENEQERIHRLTSLSIDLSTNQEIHGFTLGAGYFGAAVPPANGQAYECIGTIWSGSLFKMASVRAMGLPSADYVLDIAEIEYGYQAAEHGFRTVVVPASKVDHNIDTEIGASAQLRRVKLGPLQFSVVELVPIRLYYQTRNLLYFWTHEFRDRSLGRTIRMLPAWSWIPKIVLKFALLRRWAEIHAVLRGVKDGLLGRIENRY